MAKPSSSIPGQRDDFTTAIKRIVAERVNYRCSNPECRAQTSGPHTDASKRVSVGVAAHITAAAPGGPRFDGSLTAEQRKSPDNAIWLCQSCAKLIDSDAARFTLEVLASWKQEAESEALIELGRTAEVLRREASSPVEIHITRKYRPLIEFSLVSNDNAHWAVNRLYLLYKSEFEWEMGPRPVEAMRLKTSYEITLSRFYSEYDLVPLTPDQEIHGYEYRGRDSDHFAVRLSGTDVSMICICADVYDFRTRTTDQIKSDDIRVESSGSKRAKWDRPLAVESRRLLDDMLPLTYKTFVHLNYREFIDQLNHNQLKGIEEDLSRFGSLYIEREQSDSDVLRQTDDFVKLDRAYRENKASLTEEELRWQNSGVKSQWDVESHPEWHSRSE